MSTELEGLINMPVFSYGEMINIITNVNFQVNYPFFDHNRFDNLIIESGKPKLPAEIELNNFFGINELSRCLKNDIGKDAVFESKDIWNHCFKDLVDEEMINAWTYHDTLDKEIKMHYKSIENNKENERLERIYESNEIAQGEYAGDHFTEDNVIHQAFEGDPENVWNVD